MADFEVWNEAMYDVILVITWLEQVDAWIACKVGAVYGKLQNDKTFCIKCKRSLPNAPMFSC
jgi:adenylyl- and sulfurtransferase ThiI